MLPRKRSELKLNRQIADTADVWTGRLAGRTDGRRRTSRVRGDERESESESEERIIMLVIVSESSDLNVRCALAAAK